MITVVKHTMLLAKPICHGACSISPRSPIICFSVVLQQIIGSEERFLIIAWGEVHFLAQAHCRCINTPVANPTLCKTGERWRSKLRILRLTPLLTNEREAVFFFLVQSQKRTTLYSLVQPQERTTWTCRYFKGIKCASN